MPLKDVLIELARKAEVDLELDPRIEGGIILTMRDRPMREVIERIAKLAGLRFEFRGRSLKIELDEPYYVNYRLDYLELTRQASGNVETSTNQMSDAGVDGNASTSSVGSQSDVNFWQELEVSLEQILINSTPRPLAIRPAAAPLPLPAPEESTEPTEEGGAGLPGEADPASDGLPGTVQDPFAAPAVAPVEVAADADEDVVEAGGETAGQFTINRQAGIVSVFATKSQHELVATYLSELHSSITQQVLIEAKIMEVALSDEFESGINWRAFFDDKYGFAAPLGRAVTPPPFNLPSDATSDVVTLALNRGDLDVIANFIQRFGTVRTLSSPRVTVLQNQTAVLKVVENQVYFRLFFERIEDDNGDDQVNVNSEIQTVPVGVIIVVQPSINATT